MAALQAIHKLCRMNHVKCKLSIPNSFTMAAELPFPQKMELLFITFPRLKDPAEITNMIR